MNIAQLLHVERLSAGLLNERAGAALQPQFDAALALRPGITRGEFLDCIRLALPAALDISLAEAIANGWTHRRGPIADEGILIYSTHLPIIDVRAGEKLLACIEVRVELTVALAPAKEPVRDGPILTDGEACAGGELYLADALVLREGIRPVAIPQRISPAVPPPSDIDWLDKRGAKPRS